MKKIIIVGGGIAGLAAGIYGLKAGMAAEIYEKNPVAGGSCSGWYRGDYFIDNCIHWLTGTKPDTPQYGIWQELGVIRDGEEFVERNSFYRSELDGQTITLWRDIDRTEKEMLELSPEDRDEIHRFIEYTKLGVNLQEPRDNTLDIFDAFKELGGSGNHSKILKTMIEYMGMNLENLSGRFKHPLLKKVMLDFMAKEYEAYWLVMAYAFFTAGNGDLLKGGSVEIVRRMEKQFNELGGILHFNSPVSSIIIDKRKFNMNIPVFDKKSVNFYSMKKITARNAKGIELADGTQIEADYIICACDINYTFNTLLGKKYTPRSVRAVYKDRKNNPVYSSFQAAFAVDSPVDEIDDTLSFDCEPVDVGCHSYDRICVKNYRIYGDFIAPKGHTVLQCSIVQYKEDYRFWEKLYENRDRYNMMKHNIAEAIRYRIETKFPQYADRIKVIDCWTPATYAHRDNCYKGAYMRFITTATNRNAFLSSGIRGLRNVVLASHWLRYPGGVPTAAAMGRHAVRIIEKINGE